MGAEVAQPEVAHYLAYIPDIIFKRAWLYCLAAIKAVFAQSYNVILLSAILEPVRLILQREINHKPLQNLQGRLVAMVTIIPQKS